MGTGAELQIIRKEEAGIPAFFIYAKRGCPGRAASAVYFLVFRFTVPVAEITTGPERLFLCLWLRSLYDDLTAIEL